MVQRKLGKGPLPIDGDIKRLHQVFGSLLSDAIRFTPAGGHVEVRADRW